jgi:hypothetical protein
MLGVMSLRTLFSICFFSLYLTACGGRVPVETIVHQVGDEEKTCGDLKIELDYIEEKVDTLLATADKTTRNLGLAALATEEPLSLLFTDLSLADKRELSALKKRYNHLVRLAHSKECKPPPPPATQPPENINELIHGTAQPEG